MPQLSLYINQDTLKKIEMATKDNKISISKWVSNKLETSLLDSWPDNYFDLFGSIIDDSFERPGKIKHFNKGLREEL